MHPANGSIQRPSSAAALFFPDSLSICRSRLIETAGGYVRCALRVKSQFAPGISVKLALAAHSGGPGKVKGAVPWDDDPIQQKSFWYLHRPRALPREAREYVPKIAEAIVAGRNLDEFGF